MRHYFGCSQVYRISTPVERTRRPSTKDWIHDETSMELDAYESRPPCIRGGDLGGTGGIVPLKKLGGGDGSAFIPPPIFRKCLSDLQCKND